MKINFKNKIALVLIIVFQISFAQKKQENIGTEEVNVVKAFSPTISDAFKIKASPMLDDAANAKKETIKYSIFPFPVASTFTPAKGKAEGVVKEKQVDLFENYATFGGGNYGILNAALFVNQKLNATDHVSGMFRHLSSQGGIKNIELSNKFYDTSIDLTYGSGQKELSWKFDLGYQNQIYNWYGLPSGFGKSLIPMDRAFLINGINPKQSYNTIYLGGKIVVNESIFKEVSTKFNHFSDTFGSSENRFYVKPSFEFELNNESITTNVSVDYLGGSFKKEYWNNNKVQYGYTNFGITPSFAMNKNDWTMHIGAGLFYSLDSENTNNKFLVYPQINASYKVVGDLMIFYAGAEGSLKQNTYSDFVNENPFLSPTLNIAPTDTQFDVFAGLKGKLTNNVNYTIRASFVNERNKALFKSNDYTQNSANESYAFGNSMQVVYDDMKTIRLYGELKADVSENITFGINGTFSSYTNSNQTEAWNLPTLKLDSKLDISITKKWYGGVNVFFVGDRKDLKINNDIFYIVAPTYVPITLNSYFDLNAHLGFKYSDRLTAFLNANNITNNGYQKWMNYPVQGFQVVLGANYKFDF